ncbi:hypothetical protein P3342_009588 [Pyrenophora teres f. teres]|uniref:Uncharacterized protein n=1 Tax=Pyrenophora teres f. teres TaxID=97479 RepID=A0A6S6W6S1_9PLEO|nr:hypothetical protein P3342_009588 [Pyrenophora teres f. teres]CAE7194177.1 hypothetical protein PTTW11_07898 [Pyrenophora teres f. teres]
MSVVQDLSSNVLLSLPWSRLKESVYESSLVLTTANNDSHVPILRSQSMTSSWTNTYRQTLVFAGILSIPFISNYLFILIQYHWTNIRRTDGQIPPQYPALPVIGSTLSFLWDGASFVKKATTYAGKLTCVRISLLVSGIYLVSEPEAVADMWKQPNLSSPIYVYTVGLRYIFGMREKAIKTYTDDDSGPYRKPHPNSNVAPHNRIDFLTHDSLLRGLTGSSMLPTFQRFQTIVKRNLDAQAIGEDWVEMPDLLAFFRDSVGKATLEALFGPSLLEINPNFVNDLWEFDGQVRNLAKRLPRFMVPKAYRVRDRLKDQIQSWYQYARQHFQDEAAHNDSKDWDPYWGSVMNRERQKTILSIDGQDDAALASTDLGLIWTSVTNLVPSTMMTTLHLFKDTNLLSRVRTSLEDTVSSDENGIEVAMDKLLSKDLLQSVYAETLRLYVQSYITRCSPHEDVPVGSWWLPRNEVSMVASYTSHMNTDLWNTREGKHPVTDFWAERFLLDPNDDQSGPLKRTGEEKVPAKAGDVGVHFSNKGLGGAWIPYGGGFGACPGRLLAKRVIMFTCALLVTEYEVDIRTQDFEMDSSDFGLGTQKPKGAIAFAIRKRNVAR